MKAEPNSKVSWIQVDTKGNGQRIDNFLLRSVSGVPRVLVYKWLRTGQVRVNGGRIKPTHRVQAGDQIRLPPGAEPNAERRPPPAPFVDRIVKRIVYEDPALLVLDKPAGIPVHGGSGVAFGVIEAMRAARPEQPDLELAHRLDQDTSGCLLLCKTRAALIASQDAFRNGWATKSYAALVQGAWPPGPRRVTTRLKKNQLAGGERLVRVDPQGKQAVSAFHPRYRTALASLVEVQIETGRTHQIRVQAAHLGHPVAGDRKYGNPEFNRRAQSLGLRRLFLHAERLHVPLRGLTGERAEPTLAVTTPLPDELLAVVDALRSAQGNP